MISIRNLSELLQLLLSPISLLVVALGGIFAARLVQTSATSATAVVRYFSVLILVPLGAGLVYWLAVNSPTNMLVALPVYLGVFYVAIPMLVGWIVSGLILLALYATRHYRRA